MSSFASQVFKVAGDAARLARMLSPQRDVLSDVLRQLQTAGLTVTHCGHAAFKAADIGFSGADGFEVEDALVRVSGRSFAIEPEQRLRWFAMFVNLPHGRDAILSADIATDPASTLTAFIRCRFPDGRHVDGVRVALGTGHIAPDHYVHHPDLNDEDDFSSQLFVTIDLFSGATIAALGVVTAPST